jgi:hypothetical protein
MAQVCQKQDFHVRFGQQKLVYVDESFVKPSKQVFQKEYLLFLYVFSIICSCLFLKPILYSTFVFSNKFFDVYS